MATDTKIETFAELHDALAIFKTRGGRWLFRGHGSAQWKLVPKAGRIQWPADADDLVWFESWKRRALEYTTTRAETDWDWLAVAQHHGLATRLLDWTLNPLAAAFFALECDTGEDSAIYAFYPSSSIEVSATSIDRVHGVEFLRPRGVAQRISRQAAVFTVHSPPSADLIDLAQPMHLRKLLLAHAKRKAILQDLDFYGINRATLFPGLDGLSAYLNWYIENGFNVSTATEAGDA